MPNIAQEIRKTLKEPCKINGPVWDHNTHGWCAVNSIYISDCVPTYTNAGILCPAENITDLKTAIVRSLSYLDHRIEEAQKLKAQLQKLLQEQEQENENL